MRHRDATGPQSTLGRVATKAEQDDAGARTIRFVFSDGSVDRAGDTINPAGWALASFKANPVALWAHDSGAPPIGRVPAVWSDGTRLMGDIEFAAPEVYEFSDTVYRLVKAGYINAVSVGFLPLDYKWVGDGYAFETQELLEISVVPVPCNSNALVQARAKGLDTRPLLTRRAPALSSKAARRVREWAAEGRPATAAELALAKSRLEAVRARHGLVDHYAEARAREAAEVAERKARAATAARAYGATVRSW
jgi:HK97 family phage prohead protease